MAGFSPFITEFRSYVAQQFDLPQSSIYSAVQISRRSFTNDIASGVISLPCALIEIGTASSDEDFGVDVFTQKRAPVTVHYVTQWGPSGTQSILADIMAAFIVWVDNAQLHTPTGANPFETFQVIENGDLHSDIDESVNAHMFVESQTQYLSVSGMWSPGFLIDIS